MTGRPERKRSSLSGSSPIAPPAAPVTAPASRAADTEAVPSKPKSKYPPKVSFYQPKEDSDRIRGAIMHTIPFEGTRTLSQFIAGATMKEVERLEALYNDGKPFPPVGARELPQGRPMGE